MDIRNCRRCGKVYKFNGTAVCDVCAKLEQEDFNKIRDYLFHHPNSTILEVNQATGLDVKTISRFLKEGRVESDNMQLTADGVTCEKCGQPIRSGRYCEQCTIALQTELKKSVQTNSAINKARTSNYDHILRKKD